MNFLLDGIGADTGNELGLASPLWVSGDVWYVSSVNGSDAVAPKGKERQDPLATLAQAVTNAAAGDIIVLLEDHSEVLTTPQVVSKDLTIIGEGRAAGIPTATLQLNSAVANDSIIDVHSARVSVQNIRFKDPLQGSVRHIRALELPANGFLYTKDNYYECGEFLLAAVLIETGDCSLEGDQFVSVATSLATRPKRGLVIGVVTPGTTDRAILSNLTFDGGEYGWAGVAALDINTAMDELRATNISLLRGSDADLVIGTKGYFHHAQATGGSRVTLL